MYIHHMYIHHMYVRHMYVRHMYVRHMYVHHMYVHHMYVHHMYVRHMYVRHMYHVLTFVDNILGRYISDTIFLLRNGDFLGSSMSTCLKRCHTLVPSSASERARVLGAWVEMMLPG